MRFESLIQSITGFLLLLPIHLVGQVPNFSLDFSHLTVEEGLSHNTVYSILEDKSGLIWVGTRYGLNLYNGYKCEVFLPDQSDQGSLKGPTVMALMEAKDGKIWIGHREAGISIYDKSKGTFERFPKSSGTEIDWNKVTVRTIFEDSRGYIWVGTLGFGVVVFDHNGKQLERLCTQCQPQSKNLSGDFVFDIVQDSNGAIWIATNGTGLNAYNIANASTTFYNSTDQLNLNSFEKSLCLDSTGNLWIGTSGSGLYRFNLLNKEFTHFYYNISNPAGISHNIITDVAIEKSGYLYIATDGGGLNIYNPADGIFYNVSSTLQYPKSLNTNALYQLLFDKFGNLWIGTFNGGLNIHKFHSSPFLIHELQSEYARLGLRSVLAIKEDDFGKIWLGTDGGGLFYFDAWGKSISLKTALTNGRNFPHAVITCLEKDQEGGLWIGTFANGLSYFDTKQNVIRNYVHEVNNPNSLAHNNVWDMTLDNKGGLWIGTLGGGLNYLPKGSASFKSFVPEYNNSNSISSVQIVDVLLDRNKKYLWVASEDMGLNRLDITTGLFERYSQLSANPKHRIAGDNLQCIIQDKNGNIWIGTEFRGMNCLSPDSGKILHFDTRNGLPSNMVNSIVEDKYGYLWIATPKGIVRFDTETHTIVDFGKDENLRNNQYNPRASSRLSDGRLVFGGTNGFSILNATGMTQELSPPKVIFTGLEISGQAVPIGEWNGRRVLNGNLDESGTVVKLSYADRGVIFQFTAKDFVNLSAHHFAYQLEGFDEEWHDLPAGQNQIVFTSLEGGKYLLKLKASNSSNQWSEVRTLDIRVKPPFWESWWFYALCVVTVIGLVYLIIWYFLEKQKSNYKQKALLAEQEILNLKNLNLQKEIEDGHARLSASVLQVAHKNQFLSHLNSLIERITASGKESQSKEMRKVIRVINNELEQKDYWSQFQLTFDQMHQDFVHKLQKTHPDISNNENRICCFVRMGLTNAEISSILNITVNGVEQSKYRLKKKLNLDKQVSLNDYLKNL